MSCRLEKSTCPPHATLEFELKENSRDVDEQIYSVNVDEIMICFIS